MDLGRQLPFPCSPRWMCGISKKKEPSRPRTERVSVEVDVCGGGRAGAPLEAAALSPCPAAGHGDVSAHVGEGPIGEGPPTRRALVHPVPDRPRVRR